jgi:hypothetical protein
MICAVHNVSLESWNKGEWNCRVTWYAWEKINAWVWWAQVKVKVKVRLKVKVTLERALKAQMGIRNIALLFFNLGARCSIRITPGKNPVPIVWEAGWAPGSVGTKGGKSRPHRESTPGPYYPSCYPSHSLVSRSWRRWVVRIGVEWVELAQNWNHWRAVMNTDESTFLFHKMREMSLTAKQLLACQDVLCLVDYLAG